VRRAALSSTAREIARAGRPGLLSRYEALVEALGTGGCAGSLRSFLALLGQRTAAVNMTLPRLVSFLEDGHYLNVYEFIARGTGLDGDELEEAVRRHLRDLGDRRLKIDRLFGFGSESHYASLNLGGAGATRYGSACVIFDLSNWEDAHTCFDGDSIRACFTRTGDQALADEQILERFALGEDAEQLAALRHRELLEREPNCVDPLEVRRRIEADDSLIEIHLLGPVRREHVREVRLTRSEYSHLRDLRERSRRLTGPKPWEFDRVEPFERLLNLLDRFEIPLVLAEGG
jgi:hypothetical protein